jgi:hypothetical protein
LIPRDVRPGASAIIRTRDTPDERLAHPRRITGPIVMIGSAAIGRGTLPLIERHFDTTRAGSRSSTRR